MPPLPMQAGARLVSQPPTPTDKSRAGDVLNMGFLGSDSEPLFSVSFRSNGPGQGCNNATHPLSVTCCIIIVCEAAWQPWRSSFAACIASRARYPSAATSRPVRPSMAARDGSRKPIHSPRSERISPDRRHGARLKFYPRPPLF